MLLLIFVAIISRISGYAYFFASKTHCNVSLTNSTVIMGATVVDGNARSIIIQRGNESLSTGSVYYSGEVLNVSLSYVDKQYAFEILTGQAIFLNGSCNGTKIANHNATLVMPFDGSVVLRAGSASKHGTVLLTPTFSLFSEVQPILLLPKSPPLPFPFPVILNSTIKPSMPYSINASTNFSSAVPSEAPTTGSLMPFNSTCSPSEIPIPPPTPVPSVSTLAPVLYNATQYPTSQPSSNVSGNVSTTSAEPLTVLPTLFPSQVPVPITESPTPLNDNHTVPTLSQTALTSAPSVSLNTSTVSTDKTATTKDGRGDVTTSIATSLIVSILLVCLVVLLLHQYIAHHEALLPLMGWLMEVPPYLSVLLTTVVMSLALRWMDATVAQHVGLLDHPLVAHAVLMVVGFLGCQTLAINTLRLLEKWKTLPFIVHVFLMTVALVCMFVSIAVCMKYRRETKTLAYGTVHSWYGLLAFTLFGAAYFTALIVAIGLKLRPSYKIDKLHSKLHSIVGLLLIGFTVIAVDTGLSSAAVEGYCYARVDFSCRMSYSVGVLALVMFGLTVMGVAWRPNKVHDLDKSDHDVTMYCTETYQTRREK